MQDGEAQRTGTRSSDTKNIVESIETLKGEGKMMTRRGTLRQSDARGEEEATRAASARRITLE